MITNIRKQFQTRAGVYRSFLWLIIGAFAIGMISSQFVSRYVKSTAGWALEVNGQEIDATQFVQEVNQQQRRLGAFRQQYGEYADMLLNAMGLGSDPKALAAHSLIRQELLNQVAFQMGLHLHPEYIAKQLADPRFVMQELSGIIPPQIFDMTTGAINQDILRRALKVQNISVEQFERLVERLLSARQASEIAASASYLPEFEKQFMDRAQAAQKTFSVTTLDHSRFVEKLKKDTTPSEQELRSFYGEQNAMSKRYYVPEKRSGVSWSFDSKRYGILISDEQIDEYYQANKTKLFTEKPTQITLRRILITATDPDTYQKAEEIAQKAKQNPASFAALAREHSQDSATRSEGGLLKPQARTDMDPALARAGFVLEQDGDVSGVIETKDGLEIVQRVSKQPATYKPISAVKDTIAATLREKAFAREFVQDMKDSTDLQDPSAKRAAIERLASQKHARLQQITSQALETSEQSRVLFKTPVGGAAFFVEDGDGHAVVVTDIAKGYTPSFDSVKETVRADWYSQKAQQEMQERAQANKDLKGLIAQELATQTIVGPVSANQKERLEQLEKDGFPTDRIAQLNHVGGRAVVTNGQDLKVVTLTGIEAPAPGELQPRVEKEAQERNAQVQDLLEGFLASLRRNATIKTNELLLTI